jgi:preprotein translocase subunit SecY
LKTCSSSQQGGILGMFNMFSGGALSRFSIFALGIMPYISASIIMQLMTVVSPQMEALKKEGEAGRRKITQYTRYGTLLLAIFQGLGIAIALESPAWPGGRPGLHVPTSPPLMTLAAGTIFLMWLGEQITERGLGNGISIIIFAGIAAGLPKAIGGTLELTRTGAFSIPLVLSAVHCGLAGHGLGCVRRARPTQDPGQLCQAPSGQQGLWWASLALCHSS